MNTYPIILGINFGGHDTSASLLMDGKLIAACEEERYIKEKHTRAFPTNAIADCLKKGNISINDINEIALTFDDTLLKPENYLKDNLENNECKKTIKDIELLTTQLRPRNFELVSLVRAQTGFKGNITINLHHLCHLASCYYPSGFDEALLFSIDGIGEIQCSLIGAGKQGEITILHKGNIWPNSLGLLYAAVTHYLGWKYNSDEGIVMGLAPYGDYTQLASGNETYEQIFQKIIYEINDYEYEIDRSWISYHLMRNKWISDKFIETFGPKRVPNDLIKPHHKHVAAALQHRLEEIILNQLKRARREFGFKKLCIAGGVALNCSLNGKILESKLFDEIFVQPASGDNGTAIGACFLSNKKLNGKYIQKKWHNFYLGSYFTNSEIETTLKNFKLPYKKPKDIYHDTVKYLIDRKIIGWFQGSAEFGPRALGNRSILTIPYPEEMKDYLNSRVKFRESFRPFAPAILAEYAKEYFDLEQESPHMLIATKVKPEKINKIPAVVHVDQTARVQTVTADTNLQFRQLLEAFNQVTGCPVLLNTSFNVKGQPIVNTPEDAIRCFLSTNIDILVLGEFIVNKDDK